MQPETFPSHQFHRLVPGTLRKRLFKLWAAAWARLLVAAHNGLHQVGK